METVAYVIALLIPFFVAVLPYFFKIYDNQSSRFRIRNIKIGGWVSIGLTFILIITQLKIYFLQKQSEQNSIELSHTQLQKIDSLKRSVSDLNIKYDKVIMAVESKGLIYDSIKHEIILGDKFQMQVTNNNTGNGKQYNNNVGKVDRIISK